MSLKQKATDTMRSLTPAFNVIVFGIAAVLIYLAYHTIFVVPREAKQDAQKSKGEAISATANSNAARETITHIETFHKTVERILTRTQETNDAILSAPGAQAPIDPALHAAGQRALCLHDDRATDPVCAELLHPDDPGGEPAEAGAARTGAGGQ